MDVLLSFDLEEFDLPLEHGTDILLSRQIEISREGAHAIIDILHRHNVKATFFTTLNFATHASDVIKRLLSEGHELASHGVTHTGFKESDLTESRLKLSEIASKDVIGFRMPRMMKLPESAIREAGYKYDSSLNPTFIPGRYMNLSSPTVPHFTNGVLQIPTSVTPLIRFPLFWLAAHLLPPAIYRKLSLHTASQKNYFATYFHPWEFINLHNLPDYNIPAIVKLHSGNGMRQRLDSLISYLKGKGCSFATYSELYKSYIHK